jgi:hypothetical protein
MFRVSSICYKNPCLEYAHLGVTEYSHIGMVFVAYTYYYSRHSRPTLSSSGPSSLYYYPSNYIGHLKQANTCGFCRCYSPIPVRRTFDWCVCVGFTIVVPFQLELHLIGVLGFFLCGPIPVTRVFIDKCTGFRVFLTLT